MKNLKTYFEFLREATASTAFNVLQNKEQQKKEIDDERKTPDSQKDIKFKEKTTKQALNRTDELEKMAKNIDQNQQHANQRMEDIKKKQELLPDDPAARKQFLDDTKTDLKDVESELNNTQRQRLSLKRQKERIQKNFLKK
jgi:chromosome segregation ATPase